MNSQSSRWIGWLAVPVLFLACSSSSDDSGGGGGASGGSNAAAQLVGASGATLVQNGVTLSVPVNSLSADTSITVSVVAAPADFTLVSEAYQFGPSGTTFAKPITVTIPLKSATPGAHLFWSNASGGFDDVGGTVNGLTLTGQVTHFSIGFCALPMKDGSAPLPIDSSSGGQGGAGGAIGNGGQGGVTSIDGSSSNGGADANTHVDASNGTTDASTTVDGSVATADASTGADSSTGAADANTEADSGTAAADASAALDAAALCAPFGLNLPFAQVGTLDGAAAPDAATYTGGTITSGRYHLAGVTHYGAGQYSGTHQAALTIDTSAKTVQIASFSGYLGMTYSNADARTLQATVVCNTGSTNVSAFTWYYTASGSVLTLTEAGSSDVSVYTTP